jgi:hypothetical protein
MGAVDLQRTPQEDREMLGHGELAIADEEDRAIVMKTFSQVPAP